MVAVGSPLRPKMLKAGYSDSFTLALIINASDIAFLIPPSIGMIIYGVISGTSIGELFIAGIGPGLMILLMFSTYSIIYAIVKDVPTEPKVKLEAACSSSSAGAVATRFPGDHCWRHLWRYLQPNGSRGRLRTVCRFA
ncbi:hypothetical protein HSBAA_64380 [Vreelandella sulfidaeris]|uniref:TRAP C4-dicarboxylate transport system permease DctM subunit domain-containing protein n=1 Tax=Vreelandella sulfidaeris TaxID=115553 RepID=A0A455UFT0_9GAMM|nr:hypothetical protein HSBAA_64380 [Halomonas sulfidaeris]